MHNTDDTFNQDAFFSADALSDALDSLEAQYSRWIQEQRLLIEQHRRKAAHLHDSPKSQLRLSPGPDFVVNPRRAA